jgi:hypothetical protein
MITTSTAYSPECVEGVFCEVGLPLYGVLRNSHQTWATGIMLVGERARPALRTQVGLRRAHAQRRKRWTQAWGRRLTLPGSERLRVLL